MEGLRNDGRRWNELRRIHCQLSTSSTNADGSSYIEQGFTKVLCNVTGPAEPSSRQKVKQDSATVTCEVYFAAFSGTDRIKRGRNDKKVQELQTAIQKTFSSVILTHLFSRSEITISIHILSQDGGTLAACINAATLALIDAGIPLKDYVCACTAGQSTSIFDNEGSSPDPWLDVNYLEESDIPSLTVATVGDSEKIVALSMENKVRIERLEAMIAVGISGCAKVRGIMDSEVRRHGKEKLEAQGE
ncbi:Exosome non-catalytic core component [Arthrobotrys musiformis]|uniref:Ribosomal RNA-processing protein 41 n=1 Tax=Arthrobotrys musiformis TaxID=47236 RepID=A0AAV9VUG2_9PEZI